MRSLALALIILVALVGPAAHAGGGARKAPRALVKRTRRNEGLGRRAKGASSGPGRKGGAGARAGAPARATTLGGTRRPVAQRLRSAIALRAPKLGRRAPRKSTRKLQVRKVAQRPHVADASVSGLTVAGVQTVMKTQGPTVSKLGALGGIAGLGLIAASAAGLAAAETGADRADAAHGLTWGVQSLGEAVRGSSTLTAALGVGGGAIQTGVGLHRLRNGIKQKDRRQIILGSLDVVAGGAWIASAATGNPITAGVFLAATAARITYANAAELKALPGQIAGLARRAVGRLRGGGGGRAEPAAVAP